MGREDSCRPCLVSPCQALASRSLHDRTAKVHGSSTAATCNTRISKDEARATRTTGEAANAGGESSNCRLAPAPCPWRKPSSSDRASRASRLGNCWCLRSSNGRAAADLQIPPVPLPHGMDGLWEEEGEGVHLPRLVRVLRASRTCACITALFRLKASPMLSLAIARLCRKSHRVQSAVALSAWDTGLNSMHRGPDDATIVSRSFILRRDTTQLQRVQALPRLTRAPMPHLIFGRPRPGPVCESLVLNPKYKSGFLPHTFDVIYATEAEGCR